MTDKTIINGVDVSGCGNYLRNAKEFELNCALCGFGWCKQNPKCDFKQSALKDERIVELEEKLSQLAELLNSDRVCPFYGGMCTKECLNETEVEEDDICIFQQIKQIA